MSTYQLGVNVGVGYAGDRLSSLLAAKRAGFEAFFVNWSPESPDLSEMRRAARREGMLFQSVHAPFHRINRMWETCDESASVLAEQIACAEACARSDVPLMIVHPYIGFRNHTPTEDGIARFGVLVRAAERLGVRLAFENMEGEEYLAAIMKHHGSSHAVGFCWDTGHELCYNRGKDMMALYGERLLGTHFNDNVGVTGEEITYLDDLHLLPFDGVADWNGIMDRIRAHGFRGSLTFELTVRNKPGKRTHDQYAALSEQDFYRLAYERALRVASLHAL